MTDWFRSWHGAPTDPKWLVVAKKANVPMIFVSAIVWALFDHASQQEDRGDVRDFDVETYANLVGVSEDQVQAVLFALTEKGIIADYRLTAWEKRQPLREDNSKARVALHREREREKRTVTHGNAPDKKRLDTEESTSSLREDGAANAPDSRTLLFTKGLEELAAISGRPATKLRSMLGKWLRDVDDDALRILALISKAKQDRPADPIPWIEKHFRPRANGPPKRGSAAISELCNQPIEQTLDEYTRRDLQTSHLRIA